MSVAVAFLNHRCISFYDWTRRRWIHVLMAGLLYGLAFHFLSVNLTPSLPYTLVWIDYGAQPGLGDLMVFRYEGRPFHDEDLSGLRFFKRVGGVAGDLITVDDREVSVSRRRIGYAKVRTRAGEPLMTIAPGVIPPDHYFAQSDSLDSFDSRYAQCGLVRTDQVLGVAHVIF